MPDFAKMRHEIFNSRFLPWPRFTVCLRALAAEFRQRRSRHPRAEETRVQGKIGAKLEKFMYERCRSDFARSVVVREAREAFAYPTNDVYNAPLGM